MSLGVTVGKFYPLHLGHDYLIREAKSQVDRLVVLVGDRPGQELPGDLRASWVRALHPDVEVIVVPEDIPEEPEPWAERALAVLGGRRPDLAFTSESYGAPWAEAMGARHVSIDEERSQFSISGTALRADLAAHWEMLTPPAKGWFSKRVTVLGVESSGTTTLARGLAERYGTAWVPEYGRYYWEGRRHALGAARWETRELLAIARGQAAWEDDLSQQANRVLISDTDPLATCVWHRRYVGTEAPELEAFADGRRCDLYLLTVPDFEFVQDGCRDGEHVRGDMHDWFVQLLERKEHPYITVAGPPEARLATASAAIDALLRFPPLSV